MWLRSIYLKALRDQRWQVIGFGLALGLMASLVVFLWPSYKDDLALIELPPAIQALIGNDLSIGTAAGFINAQFFTWTPALLIVYAITQGTGAIAGEETAGTLDMLLAQPVRRGSMVLAKCAAAATGGVIIVMMAYAGFALSIPWVDIDLTQADVLSACVNALPLTMFFFALSLWLGAVAPSRSHATGVAVGVAVVSYFTYSLAAGIDQIAVARYASPFHYFGRGLPLVEGINWPHFTLLLGIAAIFVALAIRTFERRDIAPGGATEMTWDDLLRRVAG
jgi:ABC-2 type transport system permease protein